MKKNNNFYINKQDRKAEGKLQAGADPPLGMTRKKIGRPSTTLGTTWKKFKKVKKQTARGGSTAARNDTERAVEKPSSKLLAGADLPSGC